MNRVACIAVDIINFDKPSSSLAFLAGAADAAGCDYDCYSVNVELLNNFATTEHDTLYALFKLDKLAELSPELSAKFTQTLEHIAKEVSTGFDVVAISLFSYLQRGVAEMLLKQIRHYAPDVTIIAGGAGVTYELPVGITIGRDLVNKRLVDYYCLGEGDNVLPDFLRGKKYQVGLNSKTSPGETWVPQINDLDTLFFPTYRKMSLKAFRNLEGKERPIILINGSRGCVRSCSFCDVAHLWNKFRFRSGANIAAEILKHHHEVGAVNFHFTDSLINGSMKAFNEFNQEMVRIKSEVPGLADFTYNGMFIVRDKRAHPESMFKLMRDAGCESLAIGVETGSDRLRFDMNKKFTNADLDHHLEMCSKYGIKNAFLMFTSYPTETREDFEETLYMLERYQKYLINGTILGLNLAGSFGLLPGSPVYENREDIGLIVDHDIDNAKLNWVNKNNPGLDPRERILRDLEIRERALELKYPVPYADRYLQYMKYLDKIVDIAPD